MGSKVKKNIEYDYQTQLDKINVFYSQLEKIPNKASIIQDITSFFDDNFNGEKRNCNFVIIEKEASIQLKWQDVKLTIEFFGEGKWNYQLITEDFFRDIKLGEEKFEFIGAAPTLPMSEHTGFFLSPRVDRTILLEEEFQYDYTPLLKGINEEHKAKPDVKLAWSIDRYDGPLSGYCYLNNKLHFFSMVEETNFRCIRMFAIYELSLLEKLKAYYKNARWNYIKSKPALLQAYWNKNRKVGFKALKEKKNKFIETKNVVGYTTF